MKKLRIFSLISILIASIGILTSCKLLDSILGKEPEEEPLPDGTIAETYDVDYIIDGEILYTEVIGQGKKAPIKAAPQREGYDFDGWYTSNEFVELYDFNQRVESELSLYGNYSEHIDIIPDKYYKVSFDTDGGSEIAFQNIKEGNLCVAPEEPAKEGYTFLGWFTDTTFTTKFDFEAPIVNEITIYARWNSNENPITTFNIIYHCNGGSEVSNAVYDLNQKVARPENPVKEGWYFAGWYTNEECTTAYDFELPVSKDLDLYALWKQFTISFQDLATKNFIDPIENVLSIPTELPTPEKEGYIFLYWTTNGSLLEQYKVVEGTPLTNDITLYAKWNKIALYDITFNTGLGGPSLEAIRGVNQIPAELPEPTKVGYQFAGWFTSNSCAEAYRAVAGNAITKNTTLYAKWVEQRAYSITFNTQGGEAVAAIGSAYAIPAELPTPVREGYQFAGWYMDTAYQVEATAGQALERNIMLYAKWIAM